MCRGKCFLFEKFPEEVKGGQICTVTPRLVLGVSLAKLSDMQIRKSSELGQYPSDFGVWICYCSQVKKGSCMLELWKISEVIVVQAGRPYRKLTKLEKEYFDFDDKESAYDFDKSIKFNIERQTKPNMSLNVKNENPNEEFKMDVNTFIVEFLDETDESPKWGLMVFENTMELATLRVHHLDEIFRAMKAKRSFIWHPAKIIRNSIFTLHYEFEILSNGQSVSPLFLLELQVNMDT